MNKKLFDALLKSRKLSDWAEKHISWNDDLTFLATEAYLETSDLIVETQGNLTPDAILKGAGTGLKNFLEKVKDAIKNSEMTSYQTRNVYAELLNQFMKNLGVKLTNYSKGISVGEINGPGLEDPKEKTIVDKNSDAYLKMKHDFIQAYNFYLKRLVDKGETNQDASGMAKQKAIEEIKKRYAGSGPRSQVVSGLGKSDINKIINSFNKEFDERKPGTVPTKKIPKAKD